MVHGDRPRRRCGAQGWQSLCRLSVESWSPHGWFDDAVFNAVVESLKNPDWPNVTLHSYRVRWGEAEPDPYYAELEKRQKSARNISVATLVIQGGDDGCVLPATSERKEKHFTGSYERHVLAGIGHFPTREAPDRVSELLKGFLRRAAV
jgi:pimeloyl-ACP methyl ester carboxylesterase